MVQIFRFFSPSLGYKIILYSSVTTELLGRSKQSDKQFLTKELITNSIDHLFL